MPSQNASLASARRLLLVLASVLVSLSAFPQINPSAADQARRIVVKVSTALDGRGNLLRNTRLVIEGGKIVRIDANAEPVDYDLSGLTLMPGWIDTHVHIDWHFGPKGTLNEKDESPERAALEQAANAWKTLQAGFTTVQSLGSTSNGPLRDAIGHGDLPGPRVLTSLEPISDAKLTPDQIREIVRKRKAEGADLIKIFASTGLGSGGNPTMSQEQMDAACGEAKAQGLRSVVHAFGEAVGRAARAGCTSVEHGLFASDDDLRAMAEHGTYFDPQLGLVFSNYVDNRQHFPNLTDANIATLKDAMPKADELLRRAMKVPGLKIVFGTDAVAGADGRNAEEFIYRVRDGHEPASAAMISANSLAAESLGLQKQIGTLAPGYEADIIGIEGDPLKDISAVRRVRFVLKHGQVYRDDGRTGAAGRR